MRLTSDEHTAIDLIATLPDVPPFVVDELGRIDEVASDNARRGALVERETMRYRARALSSAVVMAFDAISRGVILAPYTMRQRVAIEASCADLATLTAEDSGAMYLDAVMTRDRAIQIQTWAREPAAEAAAE